MQLTINYTFVRPSCEDLRGPKKIVVTRKRSDRLLKTPKASGAVEGVERFA